MIIDPHSTKQTTIKVGITYVMRTEQSFKYTIETTSGTIISGTATINNPLEITPSTDIK